MAERAVVEFFGVSVLSRKRTGEYAAFAVPAGRNDKHICIQIV